ncbi:hypothetical protein BGZ63DRAFT_211601 [Mariannaea sp. PMI_226]|nr:hypothetical protein BGZ63DRAFT_211601 [Mariannaea sp. PMI_226]
MQSLFSLVVLSVLFALILPTRRYQHGPIQIRKCLSHICRAGVFPTFLSLLKPGLSLCLLSSHDSTLYASLVCQFPQGPQGPQHAYLSVCLSVWFCPTQNSPLPPGYPLHTPHPPYRRGWHLP